MASGDPAAFPLRQIVLHRGYAAPAYWQPAARALWTGAPCPHCSAGVGCATRRFAKFVSHQPTEIGPRASWQRLLPSSRAVRRGRSNICQTDTLNLCGGSMVRARISVFASVSSRYRTQKSNTGFRPRSRGARQGEQVLYDQKRSAELANYSGVRRGGVSVDGSHMRRAIGVVVTSAATS